MATVQGINWDNIQSASLSATSTILEDVDFDLVWGHQYEAGYYRNPVHINLNIIFDELLATHIRVSSSATILTETELQDRILTIQFDVRSEYQTLTSSSFALASRIRSGYNLKAIQDIFDDANMSPTRLSNITQIPELDDKHRWTSRASFDVGFSITSITEITNYEIGTIGCVEISGSVTSSQTIYPVNAYICEPTLYEGEWDEGTITFDNEAEAGTDFSFVFSGTPTAVVLTVDDGDNNNVNVFGLSYSSASVSASVSAPFSGDIRYRAIYSTGYPAIINSPISGTFRASAGITSSIGSIYTASYAGIPPVGGDFGETVTPDLVFVSTFENVTDDANVAINIDSKSNLKTRGSVSAPLDSQTQIHFIAVVI